MADVTLATILPFLRQNNTPVSSGGTVQSYTHDTASGPVLALVHGYPQTAYMWRHVAPLLKPHHTLFIPELPGYGLSSLPPKSDKRTVGTLLIEALQSLFGDDRPVIWIGHDRGGRVGHRLLVDAHPAHHLQAAVLLDIVPTTEQWRAFADPAAAVGYFHWPFLATPNAPQLIGAIGGDQWCKQGLERIRGPNPAAIEKFRSHNAIDHYSHVFSRPETIVGTCADYRSGAFEDVEAQAEDQKAGRKVQLPLMVIYSAANLGKVHDVEGVWRRWADGELKTVGVADGIGHYIPEEDPEATARLVQEWVEKYGR
ncbi:Fluoroacetate dehalogenase [Teratosphaeria destructans]|uniref:Fluoroacetate dehalogenase n=1 Tax=Teratosphaeria destructans TaxID=418781 RepID=A0A9W7SS21_9PEZI|nr:Fluoroacetate dehalogenase [Teratosphaeria destructans]